MHHPRWSSRSNRVAAGGKVVRIDPQCFVQGRWLAHHEGRNAVSRSLPAWLLRGRTFSGPPGGVTLAAYLCYQNAKFEQEVLYGRGPAQVGFSYFIYPPFPASPFRL